MMRILMLNIGWIASGGLLYLALGYLGVSLNLFTWDFNPNGLTYASGFFTLAALAGIWFLARNTRDNITRTISLIICLTLLGIAVVYVLPPEKTGRGWFERKISSPFWFRGGCTFLYSLPILFWSWSLYGSPKNTAKSKHAAEPS
ncbi:MAG: hypothetical protein JXR73_13970 [Candidatus Omnitrophica bacterium]|nr:hypothetical protein [Candidatus Omnitrophota bacterium]